MTTTTASTYVREMREHPMLVAGELIPALLDDTKTQSRRPVTTRNSRRQCCPNAWPFDLDKATIDDGMYSMLGEMHCQYLHVPFRRPDEDWSEQTQERWFPQIEPGDLLWVRETFAGPFRGAYSKSIYRYRATDSLNPMPYRGKWTPSIHMPYDAHRIRLGVLEVRAQRIQDISEEDAIAEGIKRSERTGKYLPGACDYAVWAFRELWESIYGKGAWERNDWTWAYTFKRITP